MELSCRPRRCRSAASQTFRIEQQQASCAASHVRGEGLNPAVASERTAQYCTRWPHDSHTNPLKTTRYHYAQDANTLPILVVFLILNTSLLSSLCRQDRLMSNNTQNKECRNDAVAIVEAAA